ncbi:putative Methyltransferase domain-containing protein [Seiridium cardinale]|uniref:Methyltransferase domain-containing protein n=1 Tax=Seiridium cardinale TaxID=138064 RepID=A0ABR2YAM8_9PEZI
MSQADNKQGHPAPQAVHHELRNAENSAAYLLPKLKSIKTTNPNIKLLDVGAGSGTISVAFAKALPDGHVTATDVKEDILPRAQAVSEIEGVKNIEFQVADVFNLPFADETFDVTHCHQVLTHLRNPWDALREMLRVTKAGGIVAAREGDFDTECIWPEIPALLKFHNFVAKFMAFGGGSPAAGRQLLSWALKAGVERKQITASFGTWSYTEKEEKRIWGKSSVTISDGLAIVVLMATLIAQGLIDQIKGGRMRKGAIDAKVLTENEFAEMATAWEEWAERDDAIVAMMSGEILIQK